MGFSAWRRFCAFFLAAALGAIAVIYAFVAIVDPFNILPLSPDFNRPPVSTNARFAFPALARSPEFDSALFGTSTSRLLRPAVLNQIFDAKFVNLAMNDSTAYEQTRILQVFARAHPAAKVIAIGLDIRWCETGDAVAKLTPRAFPEWMYEENLWQGYRELLNLYTIEAAGQMFGTLTGLKRERYGRDGYTSFVPPDSQYDRAKVAANMAKSGVTIPGGAHTGSPSTWRFPTHEWLQANLDLFPDTTKKILFFVPYNHHIQTAPGGDGADIWAECKRRVAAMAAARPNTLAVDFLMDSPITADDDNYWDALHYRTGIADRLARDLAAAWRGKISADFVVLTNPR
jgi:hypothetical protein